MDSLLLMMGASWAVRAQGVGGRKEGEMGEGSPTHHTRAYLLRALGFLIGQHCQALPPVEPGRWNGTWAWPGGCLLPGPQNRVPQAYGPSTQERVTLVLGPVL